MFIRAHYGTTKSGPPCCDSTGGRGSSASRGGFCPEMRHQQQQLDKSPCGVQILVVLMVLATDDSTETDRLTNARRQGGDEEEARK